MRAFHRRSRQHWALILVEIRSNSGRRQGRFLPMIYSVRALQRKHFEDSAALLKSPCFSPS